MTNSTFAPVKAQSFSNQDKSVTVKTRIVKGDVTVGADTPKLPSAMAQLKAGKAVHFSKESIKTVRKQLSNKGMTVVAEGKNKWTVTHGERTYTLTNRTVTRSIKANAKTYERSVRLNK